MKIFLDTSTLLGGLIDLGPSHAAAQGLFDVISTRRRRIRPVTAWPCCLEFYAVATRLPEEFRLTPRDAHLLLDQEILARFSIVDLESSDRAGFLRTAAREGIRGGRLYDAHIAEVALRSRCEIVVTENTRHFTPLERQGVRVLTGAEALRSLKRSK